MNLCEFVAQPGLQSEFWDSQGFREESFLDKQTKNSGFIINDDILIHKYMWIQIILQINHKGRRQSSFSK